MKSKYKDYVCIGLCSFIVFLPFVVRLYMGYPKGLQMEYLAKASGVILDYYTYYKQWVVMIVAGIMLLFLLCVLFGSRGDEKNRRQMIQELKLPMATLGISMCFYIASAINAKEKSVLLFGLFGECEGLPAIIAYSVLFFAGYIFFQTERSKKILKYALVGLMILLIGVCVLEYLGYPIYNWTIIQKCVLPKEYWMYREEFKIDIVPGMVSAGMESSGYLGGLCVLLFPISIGFVCEEKKPLHKILLLILSGGIFFVLTVSNSTGAFLVAIMSIILFCIIYRKTKKILFKHIGGFILVCLVMFVIINGLSGGIYKDHLMSTVQNENDYGKDQKERFSLESMQLNDGIIELKSTDKQLTIQAEKDANSSLDDIVVKDRGVPLATEKIADGKVQVVEKGYESISYWIEKNVLYLDLGYQEPVEFFLARAGIQYITFNGSQMNEIPQSQMKELEWLYPICTGRGYAWANSIPILKECLFLGKGVANFAFVFPQSEVVGMLNTHGSTNLLIEKAHNWYLQIAIDSGMISLISIMILFGVYIVKATGRYVLRVGEKTETHMLFVGLLAFMIIGCINNSSISVNPIFWVLFGVAYYQLGRETRG